jgi:hypothetical protein
MKSGGVDNPVTASHWSEPFAAWFRFMQFGWRDERDGFWSTIDRGEGCVAFQPTGTYWRGRVVGVAFAVGIAWIFVGPLLKTGRLFDFCVSRAPSPLVVFDCEVPQESPTAAPARRISANTISKIVVRENTGRQSDDMRMAQMYFVLKNSNLAVLAYQQGFDQREQVRLVSRDLAERWGVRLQDRLSHWWKEIGEPRDAAASR